MVKTLLATREIWVVSLGWEDTLEKEITTHSSILAWRIPWTEDSGGLQSMGSQCPTLLNSLLDLTGFSHGIFRAFYT